jgi:hypothetical protein
MAMQVDDENAPDGYPRDNPAFVELTQEILRSRQEQAHRADQFLKELAQDLRRSRQGG